jgi:hypothetical protein
MLFTYAKDVQRFLRDGRQMDVNLSDIYNHINAARRELAMRTQCIRRLTPIAAGCVGVSVTAGGSGYTSPTVTISSPDFPSGLPPYPNGLQATANALMLGGTITGIDITQGGDGYQNPTITITDPTGTGAEATISPIVYNQLSQGQEQYNYSDIDVSIWPGVKAVYYVNSVGIIYANWRYTPEYCSFPKYQALVRTYTATSYQYVPGFFTQFGRGEDGSLFFYPLPSQTYPIEFDCLCTPVDLVDDTTYEAIPQPWQDAVKFLAAAYCYLDLQNLNTARAYMDLYDKYVSRFSSYAMPGRRLSQYGRPI